jgi:hypothetical protein
MDRRHAHRSRGPRLDSSSSSLPARRAACRRSEAPGLDALLGDDDAAVYIASRDFDDVPRIDVLAPDGYLREPLEVAAPEWGDAPADNRNALAGALLQDATGHAPKATTARDFAEAVLARQPHAGFAISSSEICAWLLIRAIERSESRRV